MSTLKKISEAVEAGKSKQVEALITEALGAGEKSEDILAAMIDAMGLVGEKFRTNEIFVPEMLIAARAMQKGVGILKPHLAGKAGISLGKCIIGTVEGDMHDIGKNLVAMMIESAGFEVIDLGVDVKTQDFLEAVEANPDVKIVALSALLTTTMPAMEKSASELNKVKKSFKLLVGGAPITKAFADQIGADGYALDAAEAAVAAKALVG